MLIIDGVYLLEAAAPAFRPVSPPTSAELQWPAQPSSERLGRRAERRGVLARDLEGSNLELGPQRGRKALILQFLAAAIGRSLSKR